MDQDTLIARLRRRCQASTQRAVAKELRISEQYLCDVLAGRRELGPAILEALGYERQVSYVRSDERSILPDER